MASEFVRKVKGIRNIDILSPNITTENDLISTIDGEVYVATNKGYKKITGSETEQDIQLLETHVKNLKTSTDNNTSEIETLQISTDNNTSEIEKLKTTINDYKVLLFNGYASSTGEVIKLNQSYKDFSELKIKISRIGGYEIVNFAADTDTGIFLNHSNIYNNNEDAQLYEMEIIKKSPTELEIASQRSFTFSGTSSDDSETTILKIWGVK